MDNMENGRTRETTPSKTKGGRKGRRESSARRVVLAATVAGALLLAAYTTFAGHTAFSAHSLAMTGLHGMRRFGDGGADTLVIYVYAHTDVEYADNLRYFLEFGVQPGDACDYLVVVQSGRGVLSTSLPPLPPNVRAVQHPNECFDWGTFGWAIERGHADTSRYRYIIFLNSSVRGPFLPSYWPREKHWSRILTGRITDDVKLVGATISCEGANKGGVLSGEMRRNPHVQSYVVATDQVGLGLLQAEGDVLKCYTDIHDAIWYAEIGSSAAILDAGYNIDALMLRYQGVDWRDKATWGCNAGINPYAEYMYDGVNISPFEVMFVKVKEFLLEANWTTATSAKKYTTWNRGQHKIADNEYNAKKTELRNMKVLNMRARGSACFDFDFYRAKNPDLPVWGHETMWEHFVTSGQHEGRVFRFRCKPGAVEFPKPPPSPKTRAAGTAIGKGQAANATAQGQAAQAQQAHRAAGDVITSQQAAAAQKAATAQKEAAAAVAAQQQAAAAVRQASAGAAGAATAAQGAAAAQGTVAAAQTVQATGAVQQAAGSAAGAAGQAAGGAQQAAGVATSQVVGVAGGGQAAAQQVTDAAAGQQAAAAAQQVAGAAADQAAVVAAQQQAAAVAGQGEAQAAVLAVDAAVQQVAADAVLQQAAAGTGAAQAGAAAAGIAAQQAVAQQAAAATQQAAQAGAALADVAVVQQAGGTATGVVAAQQLAQVAGTVQQQAVTAGAVGVVQQQQAAVGGQVAGAAALAEQQQAVATQQQAAAAGAAGMAAAAAVQQTGAAIAGAGHQEQLAVQQLAAAQQAAVAAAVQRR